MQVEGSTLRRRSAVSERAGLISPGPSSRHVQRYGATDTGRRRGDTAPLLPPHHCVGGTPTPELGVGRKLLDAASSYIGFTGVEVDLDWGSKRRHGHGLRARSWREWGAEIVPGDAMVLPLFIVTFSCALADSVTYKAYQTFATSQTGNTISLAVAALGASAKNPLLPGVSLAGFIVSGLVFGQLGGYLGHRRRLWLLLSFTFQLAVLAVAAAMAFRANATCTHKQNPLYRSDATFDWIYMLLLAIQGGPQVTMATNAGCREIPTAMMTTPYAAFISDPTIFQTGRDTDVRARNRRALYIAVFWLGAFVGAAMSSLGCMAIAVAACKLVAMGLVLFARGEAGDLSEANGGVKWDDITQQELAPASGGAHVARAEYNVAM